MEEASDPSELVLEGLALQELVDGAGGQDCHRLGRAADRWHRAREPAPSSPLPLTRLIPAR